MQFDAFPEMAKKFCPQCGTKITDHMGRPRSFCSERCRRNWWKAHPEFAKPRPSALYAYRCRTCGQPFTRLWQPPPHLLQPCLLPARPLPQTERNLNHANTNLTLGNPPTGYPIGCECDCIGCFGIFFALDSVLFDSFFRIRPVFLENPPFCKQQPAPILTHFPGAIAFVPDSLPCPLPLITLAKS